MLLHEETEEGILHVADLSCLLLVSFRNFGLEHLWESLTDDGNQRIQKNDDVEQDAKDEDDPVDISVLHQVFIGGGQGSSQEGDFDRTEVVKEIFVVDVSIFWDFSRLCHASQLENFPERQVRIGECKNTDREDDQEWLHVAETLDDESDHPTEGVQCAQEQEESQPNADASPALDRPEVGFTGRLNIVDIDHDQSWCDQVQKPCSIPQILQFSSVDGIDLQAKQVDGCKGETGLQNVILRVKCVLFSKVSDHYVRPPNEEKELQGHRKTETEVVVSSPEGIVMVDDDLHAGQFEDFQVDVTFSEGVDEIVSRLARFIKQRQVKEVHVEAHKLSFRVKELLLDFWIVLP